MKPTQAVHSDNSKMTLCCSRYHANIHDQHIYGTDVMSAVALIITSSSESETEPSAASPMDEPKPFPEQEKQQEVQAKCRNQRKKVIKASVAFKKIYILSHCGGHKLQYFMLQR